MTGRELSEKLLYAGMEEGVRRLALKDKLATAEQIAVMPEIKVCDLIAEKYDVVFWNDEEVFLVPKDKKELYSKLVTIISR